MTDSERELELIPFRCGFWSVFFPAEFVLDLFNVNRGNLGTLNWGTFKKNILSFAIFCSGFEKHTRKRLNSSVSSLMVQDQSYGSQQLLVVNFCFHLSVTGLFMFLTRNETWLQWKTGAGSPEWAIVSLSINHRQQGNRYLTQKNTRLLSSPFPCKPQGTFRLLLKL